MDFAFAGNGGFLGASGLPPGDDFLMSPRLTFGNRFPNAIAPRLNPLRAKNVRRVIARALGRWRGSFITHASPFREHTIQIQEHIRHGRPGGGLGRVETLRQSADWFGREFPGIRPVLAEVGEFLFI